MPPWGSHPQLCKGTQGQTSEHWIYGILFDHYFLSCILMCLPVPLVWGRTQSTAHHRIAILQPEEKTWRQQRIGIDDRRITKLQALFFDGAYARQWYQHETPWQSKESCHRQRAQSAVAVWDGCQGGQANSQVRLWFKLVSFSYLYTCLGSDFANTETSWTTAMNRSY